MINSEEDPKLTEESQKLLDELVDFLIQRNYSKNCFATTMANLIGHFYSVYPEEFLDKFIDGLKHIRKHYIEEELGKNKKSASE
jgi:hypothetical protein